MDKETFKQLFLPLHGSLYRIAYRILGNEDDAKDVLQDTYMKLWKTKDHLPDIKSYEGFAITVVKNTCLDLLKKHKTYHLEEVGDIPDIMIQPSEIFENTDRLEMLNCIIKLLPPNQRTIVQLHYRDSYSLEEIGSITGLQYGNVKMILSRARKAIKEYWLKIEAI